MGLAHLCEVPVVLRPIDSQVGSVSSLNHVYLFWYTSSAYVSGGFSNQSTWLFVILLKISVLGVAQDQSSVFERIVTEGLLLVRVILRISPWGVISLSGKQVLAPLHVPWSEPIHKRPT